jgi:photosystem II stability/assembly factor-like uncharacterized protein
MTSGICLHFRRALRDVPVLILLGAIAIAQTHPSQRPASPSHPPKATASQPANEFKGIFEPRNYPKDVNLTDAFFTSIDEGWVSGEHATILHTTDGGATWTSQVGGDPTRNEHPIRKLRFLDGKRGWAVEDDPERLLRTRDGQNWEQVSGSFPPGTPVVDYAFTSETHGILLGGNGDAFYISNDGGGHWQSVGPCQLSVTVQGLAQTEGCHFIKLQMLSPRSGYALAQWSSPEAPNATSIAVFRTDNEGEHWSYVVPELRDCCGPDSFFTNMNHGILLFNNGKTYITADGGKNWHSLLSAAVELTSGGQAPPLRFADPEVGWALGHSPVNRDAYRVSFSTDGGQHWRASGDIAFPDGVLADLKFNFPRRDRAYVIGPHGMIYRYRVVPRSYTATNALPGPLMPAFEAQESSPKQTP